MVFGQDDLTFLAGLLEKHDAFAVCDEVYEHLVYDGRQHTPLMTLPGMRERCARIGSAGKTFSLTGWKVGYITAAPNLMGPIAKAHQFLTFTTAPNLQWAVAQGLAKGDDYFDGLIKDMESKRDLLANGLAGMGFKVLDTAGSYFLTVDFRPLGLNGNDVEVCRQLTLEAGVATVPVSAFYQEADVTHFLRFCFCKRHELLEQGLERLRRYFGA